jgi:predicted GH43/DUF377 family glycosyl hydrolase
MRAGDARSPRATDAGVELRPDPGRTLVRFFVPGNEDVGPQDSRAGQIIERILSLDESSVIHAMDQLHERFGARLSGLSGILDAHAERATHRLDPSIALSSARRRLLGAAFTSEYAIEGAALCNPSIVLHPEQPTNGDTAFILSVRGIGEGHQSSIGFRTGTMTAAGAFRIDEPATVTDAGDVLPGTHHRAVLHKRLAERHDDHENASFVLDPLPERFDDHQLAARLDALRADAATRRHTSSTTANLAQLAACSYQVEFASTTELSERVLWPRAPNERRGMEDARFVEVTDSSAPRYCATYTAFDGDLISQSLLTTEDFRTFDVSPIAGAAALGKGLALFPRLVDGRYAALSRADRETNGITFSHDLRCWDTAQTIQSPQRPWEVVQLGNCGSPLETPSGWLVLTHGVGPMRTYAIGAILLDLDDPVRVLAATEHPIITPVGHAGYVPNVVYSCGALIADGRLIVPYGIGDQSIAITTFDVDELLATMQRTR